MRDRRNWCKTPSRRWRTSLSLRRARRVVALWNGAADSIRDVLRASADRITMIPNGVDDPRFNLADEAYRLAARHRFGLSPDVLTVLYMGSLRPGTGLPSMPWLAWMAPDCSLLVTVRVRAAVEAAARSMLAERCRLAGVVPAEVAMAAADALVCPPRPRASRRSFTRRRVPGCRRSSPMFGALREIACDGRTGRLVPVESDATALASALRSVLEAAPTLGAATRAHCTGRYDLATVTDSWTGFLGELATL